MEYVDVETAREASGLRLVVVADAPSPWSQAAKAIIEIKEIPAVIVRKRVKDEAVEAWTGIGNAPVAMYNQEPARPGWAAILALCERLSDRVPLIPSNTEQRVLMHGYSHELMGERGLLWSLRQFLVDASLRSAGETGWPLPIAQHLAKRYGCTPGCGQEAKQRVIELLAALDARLRRGLSTGGSYYLGERLSALDIYSAASIDLLVPLPHEQCPMHPVVRAAVEWQHAQLEGQVSDALIAHRAMMHKRHMKLPMEL